jgi:hypothetical protein
MDTANIGNKGAPTSIGHQSTYCFCGIVLALLLYTLIGLLIATRMPPVWNDEVQYVDPAVNLFLGNGLTSTAWARQSAHEYWAAYPPLYQFALAGWYHIFGFSLFTTRALSVVLFSAAVGVILWAAMKSKMIGNPAVLFVLLMLLTCGYGTSVFAKSGRGDIMGMCVIAMQFAVLVLLRGWSRIILTALAGFLALMAGLQVALLGAISFGLLFLFHRAWFGTACAHAVGMLFSGLSLYLNFRAHGVWNKYLSYVSGNTMTMPAAERAEFVRESLAFRGLRDPSLVLLEVFALVLCFELWRGRSLGKTSPVLFGLIWVGLVEAIFSQLGVFARYFSYTAFMPLAGCVCVELSRQREILTANGLRFSRLASPLLVLACLGYPIVVFFSWLHWDGREHGRIETFISKNVERDDVVYSICDAYYAVKPACFKHFDVHYLGMSDSEKSEVTKVVINPEYPGRLPFLGGQWTLMEEYISPPPRWSWPMRFVGRHDAFTRRYHLQAFRRTDSVPSPK